MSAARYRLVGLHGFLGTASDWDALGAWFPDAAWEAVDLWPLFADRAVSDWPSIGLALQAHLERLVASDGRPAFLLGYSFGARLALAIPDLGAARSPFAGTCLVSCNPGLTGGDDSARAARRAADEAWARRLVDEPVGRIWKAWDAQPIFAGTGVPRRSEVLPAPRVTLARAMRIASLASQPDWRPALRAWSRPLLWVSGERDAKFRAVASALHAEGTPATFVVCENAGHRAPWDNPGAFSAALRTWINGVLR